MLGEIYILMMEPLLEVNKAYSPVMQDQKQRGIQNVPHFQPDTNFSVGSSQSQSQNPISHPTNLYDQKYNFNNHR